MGFIRCTPPMLALLALATAACDESRSRSTGEAVDGARLGDGAAADVGPGPDARLLDAGPADDGLGDAAVDAWVGDVGPQHVAPDPVLMVGRTVGRLPQLLVVDPATGRAEPWGAPIPLEERHSVLEVMFDPTLDRAVVRYGFLPPDGVQRRSNLQFAGYLSARRGEPWQTRAHSDDDVVEVVVSPTLDRLSIGLRAPLSSEACTDFRIVDFDGQVLAATPGELPCADVPRVWGFGPDYRITRAQGRFSRVHAAGAEPLDPPAAMDPDSQLLALRPGSALLRTGEGPRWVRFDGADAPPFPPDAHLVFGAYTFHEGDLWVIGDGDTRPLGTVDPPFADARPALRPLVDAPAVRGMARRMWLYVVDGQWVGALVDAQFLEAVGDAPGPYFNRTVFDAWRRDPRSDKWVMVRVHQSEGAGAPHVLHAGRFALWADGCDLVRYDFATGRVDRITLDWPLYDVAAGVPGWWGGLDDGNGRRGRNARGQPLIAARASGWGERCPDDWAGAGVECEAADDCRSAGDACVDGRCRCGEGEACGRFQACGGDGCVDWRYLESPSYCRRDDDCQPCWPEVPPGGCAAFCDDGLDAWLIDHPARNTQHACGPGTGEILPCACPRLPADERVTCARNACAYLVYAR